MREFSLIEQYFASTNTTTSTSASVDLGIGDDCALITPQPNHQLAVTTDTLVCGTHFLPETAPTDIAHKALAVNLSDLAAMGATPAYVSLALTLPATCDETWLSQFAQVFHAQCQRYGVALIGGDTTSGPLSVTITAQGYVPEGEGLTRRGAQVGDSICVTGQLGDAQAGLVLLKSELLKSDAAASQALLAPTSADFTYLSARHLQPTARVKFGQAIRPYCHSAIDLSDGLFGDLRHILQQSQCDATLNVGKLPLSEALCRTTSSLQQAREFALCGGDDYELCVTLAPSHVDLVREIADKHGMAFTQVGQITAKATNAEGPKLTLHLDAQPFSINAAAYEHQFAQSN